MHKLGGITDHSDGWTALDSKNKLYAGIEMHVDVHAWNCMILLDDKNILYAGTKLHVVVHAWNYVILLDF